MMRESELYRASQRPKLLRLRGEKLLYWVVVGLIVTFIGIFISSRRVETLEYGYRYEELMEQAKKLEDEQRILTTELAFLKDPTRILLKVNAMNLEPMKQQFWVHQSGRDLSLEDEAALLE